MFLSDMDMRFGNTSAAIGKTYGQYAATELAPAKTAGRDALASHTKKGENACQFGEAVDAQLRDVKLTELHLASQETNEKASLLQAEEKSANQFGEYLGRKEGQAVEQAGIEPGHRKITGSEAEEKGEDESAGSDIEKASSVLAEYADKLEAVKSKFREILEEQQKENDESGAIKLNAKLAGEMARVTSAQMSYVGSSVIAMQAASNTLYQTEFLFR